MSRERQALHQAYWEALPGLREAGIDSHADLRCWHQLLEDREKTDFEIFSDLASSPLAERLAIYKKLQDKDDTLLASPETIAYSVPPTIDERRAIAQSGGKTNRDIRR